MKNTYLNDNLTIAYPFSADTVMVPARGAITGMHICMWSADDSAEFPLALAVSSLEITPDAVTAALVTDTGSFICTITAEKGKYGYVNTIFNDNIAINCWMSAGAPLDSMIGSYVGTFKLDPGCIQIMPRSVYGELRRLYVNANEYNTNQVVGVRILGEVSKESTQIGNTTYKLVIDADITDESKYWMTVTTSEYEGVSTLVCGDTVVEISDGSILYFDYMVDGSLDTGCKAYTYLKKMANAKVLNAIQSYTVAPLSDAALINPDDAEYIREDVPMMRGLVFKHDSFDESYHWTRFPEWLFETYGDAMFINFYSSGHGEGPCAISIGSEDWEKD